MAARCMTERQAMGGGGRVGGRKCAEMMESWKRNNAMVFVLHVNISLFGNALGFGTMQAVVA